MEPILSAIISGVMAGAGTGLVAAGRYGAIIAQLRIEVNNLTTSKDQTAQTVATHATEIALLKQSMARVENSLTRVEAAIDNLPTLLRNVVGQQQ